MPLGSWNRQLMSWYALGQVEQTHFPWKILRVPNQNGVSQAWYILEIYHSGWKPSKIILLVCHVLCLPLTLFKKICVDTFECAFACKHILLDRYCIEYLICYWYEHVFLLYVFLDFVHKQVYITLPSWQNISVCLCLHFSLPLSLISVIWFETWVGNKPANLHEMNLWWISVLSSYDKI